MVFDEHLSYPFTFEAEGQLWMIPECRERAAVTLNLSPRGDLIEAAANLFSHLRKLDAAGASTIAVMALPHHGLGEAINDRLARAAAPK